MIKIKDGRTELYQWDTGSVLTVGDGIDEVHFARSPMGRSITVPVANGEAKVEDVLLQTAGKLFVWGFVGSVEDGYTKLEREFAVRARNKPADYVFTPPEQITMAEILEELKRVQDVVTPEAVGALVEEYLRENPVEGSVSIDATLTKQGYAADAKAVGDALAKKLDSDKLGSAVDDALRQAKDSGEFDGEAGAPGVSPHIGANGNWFVGNADTGVQAQGKDGDDYVLTDADKSEIAEEAANLVEVPGEESYRLLKTITLAEEVAQIYEVFETEYDGVMIVVENIMLASGTMALYVGGGNNSKRRVVGVSAIKNNQVLRYRLYKTHGMWESIAYYGNKSDVSTVTGQLGANVVTATSSNTPDGFTDAFEAINNIRVYSYADNILPVGLTVKIFVLGGATNA